MEAQQTSDEDDASLHCWGVLVHLCTAGPSATSSPVPTPRRFRWFATDVDVRESKALVKTAGAQRGCLYHDHDHDHDHAKGRDTAETWEKRFTIARARAA